MKSSLITLIILIIQSVIGFGVGMPFAIWLALKNTSTVNFLHYGLLGAGLGAVLGIIIWLMFRLKYHG